MKTAVARTHTGAGKYTGVFGKPELLHLLRRTLFGVKKSDLDYFKGKSMDDVVDELLAVPTTPPSPPVNDYNTPQAQDPNVPAGETWVGKSFDPNFSFQRVSSFKKWWVGQMVNHERSVLERLTLFWHNHFATETDIIQHAQLVYIHHAMLRAMALGNFKDFVKAITTDPGMLIYLNGYLNTNTAPDENYARELQELFTLGKGSDSKYTEHDVIEAAKVLTGWRINFLTFKSYFDPSKHDSNNKQFSSFYNTTTISGRTGLSGAQELDDLINMIFEQNEVAKHIVRKLYRWFVYYDIDEAAETDFIAPMADVFRDNNYEIKPLLSAFFKSEHFYDNLNRGCLIKNPVDYTIGMVRQFDVAFPAPADYETNYGLWGVLFGAIALQQMDPGNPPSVAGWPAYHQLPAFHRTWINSDTLPKRNQIADFMVAIGYTLNGHKMYIDTIRFADQFDNPGDPNALIDDMLEFLHTIEVSNAKKVHMKGILLSGQTQDHYWTDAWNQYKVDPGDPTKETIVKFRLIPLVKYISNLAEYQMS